MATGLFSMALRSPLLIWSFPLIAPSLKCWRSALLLAFLPIVLANVFVDSVLAQTLRICSYNMEDRPTTAAQDQDMRIVMQAVGNAGGPLGNPQPVDILAFQEGPAAAAEYADIEANMEAAFGGNYQSSISSPDFFGCRTGFVFNTDRVQQLASTTLTGALTHNTRRVLFRPVGGTAADNFFIYSTHLKAGTTSDDESQRALEANIIRGNAATLPAGSAIVYCGDFNMTGSDEQGFQNLFAPGDDTTAVDTLNSPFGFRDAVNWRDNIAFLPFHTQDPGASMDDRFDAIFMNAACVDGNAFEYIKGSSATLGNNGSHNLNANITTGTGAVGFSSELLSLSDHLPVFTDWTFGQVAVRFNAQLSVDSITSNFVRPAGPVTGTSGANEFQIEGTGNPITFRSFGVIDFNLDGQLAVGENASAATNVVLNLFQDNAPFTDNGPIGIYLASAAAAQVSIDNSIQYQATQNGLASVPSALSDGAVKVATYAAVNVDGGNLPDGTMDPVGLFGPEIDQAVADALNGAGVLRFLITPDHPQTAATYTGFASVLGAPSLTADLVVDDGSEDVFVNQISISNGSQGAGIVLATQASDDDRVSFFSAAPTASDPPLRLQASGILPTAIPQTLSVTLETQSNTPNVLQTVELFNFDNSAWEEIGLAKVTLTDNSITADATGDVSRFVGSGNLILTRMSWSPSAPVLFFPWSIGIDEFKWTISQ